MHRDGAHRVESVAGETLEIVAPATHLSAAMCTRKPADADDVECTAAANVLRTTALTVPGVYAFNVTSVTGFITRLVAIVFPADALELPRIALDAWRRDRPIVERRLILRGIANEARLDVADDALADPNWTARGDLIGTSGSAINLQNYGA